MASACAPAVVAAYVTQALRTILSRSAGLLRDMLTLPAGVYCVSTGPMLGVASRVNACVLLQYSYWCAAYALNASLLMAGWSMMGCCTPKDRSLIRMGRDCKAAMPLISTYLATPRGVCRRCLGSLLRCRGSA
jgi:hypothetical protein